MSWKKGAQGDCKATGSLGRGGCGALQGVCFVQGAVFSWGALKEAPEHFDEPETR